MINYLIQKGIAKTRLQAKGYGKGSPKKIRRKLTEKYPFLKDLFFVYVFVKKNKEDEEKQEICNQLNRRTEFRVTSTTYGMFDKEGRLIESPARN